jgi:hypothetical protein
MQWSASLTHFQAVICLSILNSKLLQRWSLQAVYTAIHTYTVFFLDEMLYQTGFNNLIDKLLLECQTPFLC